MTTARCAPRAMIQLELKIASAIAVGTNLLFTNEQHVVKDVPVVEITNKCSRHNLTYVNVRERVLLLISISTSISLCGAKTVTF